MAERFGLPFLGRIPLDPDIVKSGDEEQPYMYFYSKTKTAGKFDEIVEKIVAFKKSEQAAESGETENDIAVAPCLQYGEDKRVQIIDIKEASMKFAVPTNQGKLCAHFGHCEAFALIDIDTAGAIINETYVTPPPHEPGLLPDWLSQKGVNCVIAGGMGSRAQQLFAQKGIRVVTGAMGEHPQEIVEHHLKGTLQMGANTCDH